MGWCASFDPAVRAGTGAIGRRIAALSYNIAGLLPKLDNVAFVNYIPSFDLVCLTETYVASEFQSNLFKDFGVFVAKAKKLSYHGRYSGGL